MPGYTATQSVYLFQGEVYLTADPFFRSIGYSEECLGLHYGYKHQADLGDGDGRKSQAFLARQNFPIWGTCWESLAGSYFQFNPLVRRIPTGILTGGHHFRAWKQNGTEANSGAWFIGYEITFSLQ